MPLRNIQLGAETVLTHDLVNLYGCLICDGMKIGPFVDQREAMQSMLDRGVATRRGIMCIHREKPYAETVRFPLPISEDAQDRTILLPLYPQMTEAEQDQVIGALQEALRHRTAGGSSSSARRPHAHSHNNQRR